MDRFLSEKQFFSFAIYLFDSFDNWIIFRGAIKLFLIHVNFFLFFRLGDNVVETDDLEGEVFTVNPLMANVPHHIETSELICNANQLTSFYSIS